LLPNIFIVLPCRSDRSRLVRKSPFAIISVVECNGLEIIPNCDPALKRVVHPIPTKLSIDSCYLASDFTLLQSPSYISNGGLHGILGALGASNRHRGGLRYVSIGNSFVH